MAQYTILTDQDISSILADYNIFGMIAWSVLEGGSENSNYFIKTWDGKFVLTICEQKTKNKTAELADFLEYLAKNDFTTSKIIRGADGQALSLWNDKPLLLKQYLPGLIIEDIPNDVITLIGQELGRLHQIKPPDYLPVNISYGLEHFSEIDAYAPNAPFRDWLFQMQEYILDHSLTDLPKALIHGDVFFNNVIISADRSQATIMDFEEACHYYRVFDLGMIIIGLCCKGAMIDPGKVSHLFQGYQQQIKLEHEELNSLQAFTVYAATATAFWRHKQNHFVHPNLDLHDHYLAMKNLADYAKSLPNFLDLVKAISNK